MLKSIFDLPALRPVCRLLFAIPIEAGSTGSSREAGLSARQELTRGNLVGIFPEGSITLTGQVEAFGRGVERIAQDTGVPMVPVYIGGMFGHPLSYKGSGPGRSWDPL